MATQHDSPELLARTADLTREIRLLRETGKAHHPAYDPASYKAAAIMGGAVRGAAIDDAPAGWLKAFLDPVTRSEIKAVLGTSDATGQAIVPNNVVDAIVSISAQTDIYRSLMQVVPNVTSAGVDIPYEVTGQAAALLQGAYGSNKDVRDFTIGLATATMYTIAQIVDVGNQLLRQSEGAAEQLLRQRIGKAFGLAEASFIINGTGTNQPLGILQAILAFGDVAAHKYTLNSESRVAALTGAISKLETRGERATGIVLNPTDFWEMSAETLGSSGSGGWAMDPVGGATSPNLSVWGVPVYRDATLPVGTALVGNWDDCAIYTGPFTLDVSSEAGTRWDQNVTGFRGEEQFGFNAEPYVRTGKFVKVLGL